MNIFSFKEEPVKKTDIIYKYIDSRKKNYAFYFSDNDFSIKNPDTIRIKYEYLDTIFPPRIFLWDRLKDIDVLVENGRYKSSLILAAPIPDICSKVEYNQKTSSQELYEKWFNENVYEYEKGDHGKDAKHFDCVNGYMCYSMRCGLVHGRQENIENIPNHPSSSLKYDKRYEKIIFRFSNKKYSELFIIEYDNKKSIVIFHSAYQLVKSIIYCADSLYSKTEDKTNFFDGFDITNCDEYELIKETN